MEYHCCGMTDYYLLTGVNFQKPADSLDTSTTCIAPDAPENGAYTGVCAYAVFRLAVHPGVQLRLHSLWDH